MITGLHAILYSRDPEADRLFLRDVLHLESIDAGDGWLIFGVLPGELAVHPADQSGAQGVYLLCDDLDRFLQEMAGHNVACTPVQNPGWGRLTYLTLPGGGLLGVYQPRHPRPGPRPKKPKSQNAPSRG